jgi:glutaredoxin
MIVLYVLEHCPYCNNSLNILKENNIKYKSIIVPNTTEDKNFYKKQNNMSTFPQIFMQIDKDNFMKVGGNSDLIEIIEHCNYIKNSNISLDSIYYMYQNMFKAVRK